MRSNLFSKLDSFWKSILSNLTSKQNQPPHRKYLSLTWIKKNEKSRLEVEFTELDLQWKSTTPNSTSSFS